MTIRDLKAEDIAAFADASDALSKCGFQATNAGRAIEIIKKMRKEGATVFFTFTSNMVASGLRGVFAEMCRRKLVDGIITAGGSLDHDLIRSAMKYELGDFMMDDAKLHQNGTNRIGNILGPNECYVYLEGFMKETFEELYSKDRTTC